MMAATDMKSMSCLAGQQPADGHRPARSCRSLAKLRRRRTVTRAKRSVEAMKLRTEQRLPPEVLTANPRHP